jgi:Flp pilus assembly protein TadD
MQLGLMHYEGGEFYDAAQAFRRASRLRPERYEPHYDIGMVYEAVGHFPQAIREYQAALELAPDQVEVTENLAMCYIACGTDTDEALELVHSALKTETRPEWVEWLTRQEIRLKNLGVGPDDGRNGALQTRRQDTDLDQPVPVATGD